MKSKKTINVAKVIELFGGKHQIVNDYSKMLKIAITAKAIEKWKERGALPSAHILNLTSIAQKKQINFDLGEYIR